MSFVRVPPDGAGKRVHSKTNMIDGGTTQVETQIVHLASADNPEDILHIDPYGAATVAFAEGAPSLDAFGNLRVSNSHMIGAYEFTATGMADLFWDQLAGAGDITHVPQKSAAILSVTDAATDAARRTTNRYHYYMPGTGMFIIQTLQLGDAGKPNNVRQWGYYDEFNGLFWRLSGTTFNVVIRTKTSGSVVETVIPQSSWNGDRLDGTGLSGVVLDLTKANFYWIDLAWLGVGVVRFGIQGPDGQRLVCHTFHNPNANVDAYMATATLPIRWANYNTGVTSGTSELKAICAAIYAEGLTDEQYTYWRYADMEATNISVTTNTPFLSVRSKLTLDGQVNRVTTFPDTLSVYIAGDPVKIDLVYPDTLTGATWTLTGISTLEGDVAASAYSLGTDGYKFVSFMLAPGAHTIDLKPYYELNDEGIMVNGDGTTADITTFAATRLSTNPTTVTAALTYRELR